VNRRRTLSLLALVGIAIASGCSGAASAPTASVGWIAFTTGAQNRIIEIVRPDGSRRAAVTRATGKARRIAGAKIRITAWAPSARRGTLTRLTRYMSDSSPVWSPDGTQIAFARVGDEPGICVVRPGGRPRRVGAGVAASWAPDSRRLV
jgi:Tol biopolymer transport system component